MSKPDSCIKRLVDHNDGPVALAAKLGGKPVHQEIARWVARGWASPHHIFSLEPFLPPGMQVRDLAADKERAKNPKPKGRAKPTRPTEKVASPGGERRQRADTYVDAGAVDLMVPTSTDRRKGQQRRGAKH